VCIRKRQEGGEEGGWGAMWVRGDVGDDFYKKKN